jgi:hypothetical protein
VFELPPAQNCRGDAKNPRFAGVKSVIKAPAGWIIVAGPALSDFSLWAATLDPPKPQKPTGKSWGKPGELAAKWTAYEIARRVLEDAQYIAADEERLQIQPVDASGNYALRDPHETS